jgi:hypothetical protein
MPPKKQIHIANQTDKNSNQKLIITSKKVELIPKRKSYSQAKFHSQNKLNTQNIFSLKSATDEETKIDSEKNININLIKMKNSEIEKWKCNILNGVVGMLRDICMRVTKYFKNDSDIIEVYFYFLFILFFVFIFLF